MEARFFRAAFVAAIVLVSAGATYKTPNFTIQTQSAELAERLGKAAEQYRKELAVAWLGEALPNWSQPCVMTVQAGPNLGAGGATTFVFYRGEVFGWRMTIQGSVERLFDSVLPHEITHMVFACRFRQPLPRWADEGGATSVEHPSELARHRKMLVQFLQTRRGIAFNQMFAMTEYPRDVMPLYAQGYSLAEYLIQNGGRRKYVDFLTEGLKTGCWSEAIHSHYGITDLGALQNTWLAWVRQGSHPLVARNQEPAAPKPETLAVAGKLPRPEPNLIYRAGSQGPTASRERLVPIQWPADRSGQSTPIRPSADTVAAVTTPPAQILPASGWHVAGSYARASRASSVEPSRGEPLHTQTALPQPVEKARQIILEWENQ